MAAPGRVSQLSQFDDFESDRSWYETAQAMFAPLGSTLRHNAEGGLPRRVSPASQFNDFESVGSEGETDGLRAPFGPPQPPALALPRLTRAVAAFGTGGWWRTVEPGTCGQTYVSDNNYSRIWSRRRQPSLTGKRRDGQRVETDENRAGLFQRGDAVGDAGAAGTVRLVDMGDDDIAAARRCDAPGNRGGRE